MDVKEKSTGELMIMAKECLEEVERRRSENSEKLKYFDNKINLIYHEIETKAFDAYGGWQMNNKLQYQLRLRRIIKNEMWIFNFIHKFSNDGKGAKEWRTNLDYINGIIKGSDITTKNLNRQKEWSNASKLGNLTYRDVDNEYNKKYGKVEDQITILKDRLVGSK